jgi:hypothetical protein
MENESNEEDCSDNESLNNVEVNKELVKSYNMIDERNPNISLQIQGGNQNFRNTINQNEGLLSQKFTNNGNNDSYDFTK